MQLRQWHADRRRSPTRRMATAALLAVCMSAVGLEPVSGELTRLEILQKLDYAEGREFAGVGAYQRLLGRAHFAVDPSAEANAAIVDLPLAARNEQGRVEFSADLEILAPRDLSRASGLLLYDVNNRGRRMVLRMFNQDADDFLMRQGVIVVWSGWIAEVLPQPDENAPGSRLLRLDAPLALDGQRPISGPFRAEVIVDEPTTRMNITTRSQLGSYPPAGQGQSQASLSWRLRERDQRVAIPHEQWRLEVEPAQAEGQKHLMPKVELVVPGGLLPGYIYELIYEAEGPVVQGLGLAGIRDLVSFLRYDETGTNPLRRADGRSAAERAAAFGISQSGRCLRMFLYQGFNADEQGRQVFDGLLPHVAGAGLGFFNHRFASPTRFSTQHASHSFPCDMFPFTYGPATDPFSGREDSLLARARQQEVVPKVMHVQNSAEYWDRGGSLVHTDPEGRQDADIPPEVRIYAVGGAQHGWGTDLAPQPPVKGLYDNNPTDYRPHLRALLIALDQWIRDDLPPPDSIYPRIDDGTLVDWTAESSQWQPLPGVRYPEVIQIPQAFDFGERFAREGILSRHPPKRLGKYRVRIPVHDENNNERGMLQLPLVAVPLGTFTGWNFRGRTLGGEDQLLELKGSYFPFPRTQAERRRSGDPRRALEEQYADRGDYLDQVQAAIRQLVEQRHLLEEDAPRVLARARQLVERVGGLHFKDVP